MSLTFTGLPEGVEPETVITQTQRIDREAVEAELKKNPGKWALIYNDTTLRTIGLWRKVPGFELAKTELPGQDGVKSGSKHYKVWLRWVGGVDELEQKAIEAEASEAQALAADAAVRGPADAGPPPQPQAQDAESYPTSPVIPAAPGLKPPPRTAFEQAYAAEDPA